MLNLYPSQMRAIAAMCDALDSLTETDVHFGRIEVVTPEGERLGWLVDEIGGSFSWALPEWFAKDKADA